MSLKELPQSQAANILLMNHKKHSPFTLFLSSAIYQQTVSFMHNKVRGAKFEPSKPHVRFEPVFIL